MAISKALLICHLACCSAKRRARISPPSPIIALPPPTRRDAPEAAQQIILDTKRETAQSRTRGAHDLRSPELRHSPVAVPQMPTVRPPPLIPFLFKKSSSSQAQKTQAGIGLFTFRFLPWQASDCPHLLVNSAGTGPMWRRAHSRLSPECSSTACLKVVLSHAAPGNARTVSPSLADGARHRTMWSSKTRGLFGCPELLSRHRHGPLYIIGRSTPTCPPTPARVSIYLHGMVRICFLYVCFGRFEGPT